MIPAVSISVITPSYNRVGFIQTAIDSVLAQGYPALEHIIVDGGSTDGTLQLLSTYTHITVVSEPDKGVYDALNKGIALARGNIVAQLNTDDKFEPGVFKIIADLFIKNPNIDAVSAGARIFEIKPEGEKTIVEYGGVDELELPYRATIGVPVFNAWFFRKKLFETVGSYSLDYPLIADRDFLIRCYLNRINIVSINAVFYHYCQHAESLTIKVQNDAQIPIRVEALRLAEKYLQANSADVLIRKYCSQWHDFTAIELCIDFVRHKDYSSLLKIIQSAVRFNPQWLLLVAIQSPSRLWNYWKKTYGSTS